jgi:Heavy metal associated domain 2
LEDIEIIASRPGQLSLNITRVKGNEVLARELQDRLEAIRGIHQVEADAIQGLVSIDYDRQRLSSLSFLLQLKETFSSLFPEISVTKLATTISRTL